MIRPEPNRHRGRHADELESLEPALLADLQAFARLPRPRLGKDFTAAVMRSLPFAYGRVLALPRRLPTREAPLTLRAAGLAAAAALVLLGGAWTTWNAVTSDVSIAATALTAVSYAIGAGREIVGALGVVFAVGRAAGVTAWTLIESISTATSFIPTRLYVLLLAAGFFATGSFGELLRRGGRTNFSFLRTNLGGRS